MLRLKALPEVLRQATTDGVHGALILTHDGSLLASLDEADPNRSKVVAAIVANLWDAYREKSPSPPETMILDCDQGVVAVKAITEKLLLCLYADNRVPIGILKLKLDKQVEFLAPSLSQVNIE